MDRRPLVWLFALMTLGLAVPSAAQPATPGTIYRVFLKDGQPLPSYGEAVRVEDRLVFNLVIHRAGTQQQLQLMSLPIASVDLARTARYAEAMHAAFYAATRGEAEYGAMTTQVGQTLEQLAKIEDKSRRLQLAEQARQRLVTWSRENYRYREQDVRELVDLFDDLVAELRMATGQAAFSFELVAGSGSAREPLVSAPSARDSIALALAAAHAADINEERIAILRGAAEAVAAGADAGDLAKVVAEELGAETQANAAYSALVTEFTNRATEALGRADVPAIERLRTELAERDRQLGSRRPQQVAELVRTLQARLDATHTHRLALDHYAYVRSSLLAYERRIRPALSTLDGLTPVLQYVRDMRSMAFDRIEIAAERLRVLQESAEKAAPPDDLQGVHATLMSAVGMAREAVSRRRQAVVTNSVQTDREASAAAAGALLLAERMRQDLISGLYPPKPQ